MSDRVGEWERLVTEGPGAQLDATAGQLASLAAGDPGVMATSGIAVSHPDAATRWGMCGRLTTWSPGEH